MIFLEKSQDSILIKCHVNCVDSRNAPVPKEAVMIKDRGVYCASLTFIANKRQTCIVKIFRTFFEKSHSHWLQAL